MEKTTTINDRWGELESIGGGERTRRCIESWKMTTRSLGYFGKKSGLGVDVMEGGRRSKLVIQRIASTRRWTMLIGEKGGWAEILLLVNEGRKRSWVTNLAIELCFDWHLKLGLLEAWLGMLWGYYWWAMVGSVNLSGDGDELNDGVVTGWNPWRSMMVLLWLEILEEI